MSWYLRTTDQFRVCCSSNTHRHRGIIRDTVAPVPLSVPHGEPDAQNEVPRHRSADQAMFSWSPRATLSTSSNNAVAQTPAKWRRQAVATLGLTCQSFMSL
ncbi:hypothetical protein DPSP01_003578 [Paraphaeosphaeria sporulosa]